MYRKANDKNSNRQKHLPLNTSLSLNAGAFNNDDNDIQIMEILDTRRTGEDPLDIITQKDYFSVIEKEIDENLSDFEKKVLNHYKNGESYSEIAEKLKGNKNKKKIRRRSKEQLLIS